MMIHLNVTLQESHLKKGLNRWNHLQSLVTTEKVFPDKVLENQIKNLTEANFWPYQNERNPYN